MFKPQKKYTVLLITGILFLTGTIQAKTFTAKMEKQKLFTINLTKHVAFYSSRKYKRSQRKWFLFEKTAKHVLPEYHVFIEYAKGRNMAPEAFYKKYKGRYKKVLLPKRVNKTIEKKYPRLKKSGEKRTTFGKKVMHEAFRVIYNGLGSANCKIIDYYVRVGNDNYLIRGYVALYTNVDPKKSAQENQKISKRVNYERLKAISRMFNSIEFYNLQ